MDSNLESVETKVKLFLGHQNSIAPFWCFFRLEKMKAKNSKIYKDVIKNFPDAELIDVNLNKKEDDVDDWFYKNFR